MKLKFLYCTMLTLLFVNCKTYKKDFKRYGDKDDAIRNAVLDFSHTKLYQKDSVFSILLIDTIDNIFIVNIGGNTMKLLKTKNSIHGSKETLPSGYLEKNNKLFFWMDKDHELTQEAINIYDKYNLLQDDEDGLLQVADFYIDDAAKAATYFFCKNDFYEYKRIITNKSIYSYSTPKLKCP